MRKIEEIILHCSGTDLEKYDFASMRYDHVNSRGWSDIGYHFGIDHDGDIHILRPIDKAGAHCRGRNKYSIGICVLGLQWFNLTQMEQLGRLVKMLMLSFDLSVEDVKPHSYYNKNKMCPVFDVDKFKKDYLSGS